MATDCVDALCDAGSCVAQNKDGASCDDGLYCTESDACMAGECTGTARQCETTGQCVMGACNEDSDSCELVPDPMLQDTACDDGDPCTDDGSCNAGACEIGPDSCAALTDDCTMGFCDGANGCATMPINETMACDVGNSCATSICQAGACIVTAIQNENAACDDGLYCTKYERCAMGVCTPGPSHPVRRIKAAGAGLATTRPTPA